jgi:hypothetical protein
VVFGFSVARHAVTYHTYDGIPELHTALFQTSSRCAAITCVETRKLDIHCMLAQANFASTRTMHSLRPLRPIACYTLGAFM